MVLLMVIAGIFLLFRQHLEPDLVRRNHSASSDDEEESGDESGEEEEEADRRPSYAAMQSPGQMTSQMLAVSPSVATPSATPRRRITLRRPTRNLAVNLISSGAPSSSTPPPQSQQSDRGSTPLFND